MTFADLLTTPELVRSLEKINYTQATTIQQQAIPAVLRGENVVGIAHTGTGKTLAFALPVIERLQTTPGICVIVVPTRELALQMDRSIRRFSRGIAKMNPCVLTSGTPIERQKESLATKPRIIIGTPGRLIEHLDKKNFPVKEVSIVVLDEADRLLTSGFIPQIDSILRRTPENRQTLLFSATMPIVVTRLQQRFAPTATIIKIEETLESTGTITHEAYKIGPSRRNALLTRLIHNTPGSVLIFTATKRATQRLYSELQDADLEITTLHGDRTAAARKNAAEGFRKGEYQALITTDISSRGIDVPGVALVINYHLPQDAETYIHRAGRTARAGKSGKVASFVIGADERYFGQLQDELGIEIPVVEKEK